jgi:hypothetical protein
MIKARRMRWAGHMACMEKKQQFIQDFVGKAEGKRFLGSPSHKF